MMRTCTLLVCIGAAVLLLAIGAAPVVFAQAGTPTPLPLYALPSVQTPAYTSSSIAVQPDDTRIVAAVNMLGSTITFANPGLGRILGEYPVAADPRSVAFTPDSTRALVVSRAASVLTVLDVRTALAAQRTVDPMLAALPLGGIWAYGVVANNDTAYISLLGSDRIAIVDLTALTVTGFIDTPDSPAGLMLWGDFLYVTHFWSGQVSLIYLPQRRVIETTQPRPGAAVLQSIEPDVGRGVAYLPSTRSSAGLANQRYDTMAQPVVTVVDLRNLAGRGDELTALLAADQPVNMPFALALDRFARRLYVASAGSDAVSVIDLETGLARAHIEVGANPRGLVLNADNTRLYVHNALDNSITTLNTGDLEIIDTLVISSRLQVSIDVLLGAQMFHTATDPRLTTDNGLSCATCHFDGMSDGRTWDTPTEAGYAPRNTPLLYALPETVPYTWTGAWDELADSELKVRGWMAGSGLINDAVFFNGGQNPATAHTALSPDLDVLTEYLLALTPPPTAPPVIGDAGRGAVVFAEQACASCHVGAVGTNLERVDVGTGGAFDTPSLRWLWLSAPYFHDGRAATLREVFEQDGAHQLVGSVPAADIDALVAYLLAWNASPPTE